MVTTFNATTDLLTEAQRSGCGNYLGGVTHLPGTLSHMCPERSVTDLPGMNRGLVTGRLTLPEHSSDRVGSHDAAMDTVDRLLTTQQLAEYLAVPVATLYAWRHAGAATG
jgi:hypothetical protein